MPERISNAAKRTPIDQYVDLLDGGVLDSEYSTVPY